MITLAGIDVSKAKNTLFFTQDAEKMLTIKAAKHTQTYGSEELTVTYKVGKKLKDIQLLLRSRRLYAAEDCLDYILSGEEVADRDDPNRGSDAYLYALPELDEDKVAPINPEEKMDRFAWFVAVATKVAQPDMLAYILENAPKKKNGTFVKNKLVVVAALPIVFGAELGYFEIAGKAKTDNLLEITIQERRFSEEEWLRSKDNVYLQHMARNQKDNDSEPVLQTVKISAVSYGKKKTFEVSAIQMEDGKLAINAKPYRPISSFSCVKGNDQKGYEILELKNSGFDSVCKNGVTYNVSWDLPKSADGIGSLWAFMEEPLKYIRTGKKAYLARTERYLRRNPGEKLPERSVSEQYISEVIYQALCIMENLNDLILKPAILEKIAAAIESNEDGTLIPYKGADIAVTSAPGREKALVYGELHLRNQKDNVAKIWYSIWHKHDDEWSEYQEG
jgi:hypothetical protein